MSMLMAEAMLYTHLIVIASLLSTACYLNAALHALLITARIFSPDRSNKRLYSPCTCANQAIPTKGNARHELSLPAALGQMSRSRLKSPSFAVEELDVGDPLPHIPGFWIADFGYGPLGR